MQQDSKGAWPFETSLRVASHLWKELLWWRDPSGKAMATIKKPTGPQGGSSALVVWHNKQAEKPLNVSQAVKPNREWQLARTESSHTTLFGVGGPVQCKVTRGGVWRWDGKPPFLPFPPSRPPSSSLRGEQHALELCSLWPACLLYTEGVLPASECWDWDQMNHVSATSQRTQSQALNLCEIQVFSSVKMVLRTPTFLFRWGGLISYLVSLSMGKNYW